MPDEPTARPSPRPPGGPQRLVVTPAPVAEPAAAPRTDLSWLGRAVGLAPLLGGLIAGALLWIPSHSLSRSLETTLVFTLLLGLLRAADPWLHRVWDLVGRIPFVIRLPLAFALPAWYAWGQINESASGTEIRTTETTLMVGTVLAYVLLRPGRHRPRTSAT